MFGSNLKTNHTKDIERLYDNPFDNFVEGILSFIYIKTTVNMTKTKKFTKINSMGMSPIAVLNELKF